MKFISTTKNVVARVGDDSSMEKERNATHSAGCYLVRKTERGVWELLLLYQKYQDGVEKYVLPKGHKDGDEETLDAAAKRETTEETGYTDFTLVQYLGSMTYEIDWKEYRVIKSDHYFLAILNSEEKEELDLAEYEKEYMAGSVWLDLEEAFKRISYGGCEEFFDIIRRYLASK